MARCVDMKLWCSSTVGFAVVVAMSSMSAQVFADGTVVDKIYHPYVDALERELEYRSVFQSRQKGLDNSKQIHQLSIGTSLGQKWFGEAYVVGTKSHAGNFDVDSYELELKWQITEQGQYGADWGLLFEYETKDELDAEEFVLGVLVEKEFGRFSGTANLSLIEEWGDDSGDEFEKAFAMQARYRYSRNFEPAIELYTGQNSTVIGPALLGGANVGVRKSIHWEAGLMFGLDEESPDTTFRFLMEFEF